MGLFRKNGGGKGVEARFAPDGAETFTAPRNLGVRTEGKTEVDPLAYTRSFYASEKYWQQNLGEVVGVLPHFMKLEGEEREVAIGVFVKSTKEAWELKHPGQRA